MAGMKIFSSFLILHAFLSVETKELRIESCVDNPENQTLKLKSESISIDPYPINLPGDAKVDFTVEIVSPEAAKRILDDEVRK